MACPSGFEVGPANTCHVRCPSDFTFLQDRCVLASDSTKSVTLNALPGNADEVQTSTEMSRVNAALEAIRLQAVGAASTHTSLVEARENSRDFAQAHTALQRQYAEVTNATEAIRNTTAALRPARSPTAPAIDLSRERNFLLHGVGVDVLFLQVALGLAVLSLLGFLILPREAAQGVTVLLLATGIALGFFLRK